VKHFAAAPLSLVWLVVLSVTTRIQQSAGRRQLRRIERGNSTNLRRLRREPLRVLVTSLLWVDEDKWWPHLPVFAMVVAPAEHRLRWSRWTLVGFAAHVVGTYVSQGYVRLLIKGTGRPGGWRMRAMSA
jgi:hypothetical protein